jgi:hypothetical protein
MGNYNASELQKLKMVQGAVTQPLAQVPYDRQSYADKKRAQAQASNDNNWQKTLQAAAMASMMDNKTALGFGLGSLLANNWDRWFGKKGASSNKNTTDNVYAGTKENIPPMNMTLDNGVIHYEQPLPNGYELGSISYSGTDNVPPSTLTLNNDSFTQSLGLDNFKAKNPMDMSTNPANNANYMKENGMATSPWSMSKPSVADMQNNALGGFGDFDPNSELYKKLFGGGK